MEIWDNGAQQVFGANSAEPIGWLGLELMRCRFYFGKKPAYYTMHTVGATRVWWHEAESGYLVAWILQEGPLQIDIKPTDILADLLCCSFDVGCMLRHCMPAPSVLPLPQGGSRQARQF